MDDPGPDIAALMRARRERKEAELKNPTAKNPPIKPFKPNQT